MVGSKITGPLSTAVQEQLKRPIRRADVPVEPRRLDRLGEGDRTTKSAISELASPLLLDQGLSAK